MNDEQRFELPVEQETAPFLTASRRPLTSNYFPTQWVPSALSTDIMQGGMRDLNLGAVQLRPFEVTNGPLQQQLNKNDGGGKGDEQEENVGGQISWEIVTWKAKKSFGSLSGEC